MLGMERGYEIRELEVEEGEWLAGRRLEDTALTSEGVLVLAVRKADGRYFGAPDSSMEIRPRDTLLMYGRAANLAELDDPQGGTTGDAAHEAAVHEQQKAQAAEAEQ